MTLDLSTKESVLGHLSRKEMSMEAALAAINALAEVQTGGVFAQVGTKGTVCVYGLQVRPVSLYVGQWRRLLAVAKHILAVCDWLEKGGYASTKEKSVEYTEDERKAVNAKLKADIPAPK